MAVTSDAFNATDLSAVIPEVWTPIVMEELFARAVAANFFTDLSPYLANGGDIAHVPDVFTNAFSVSTQSTQGAEITTQGPAQNDITLSVTTHNYIAYIIGDKDRKQLLSSFDFNAVYAKKAAGALRIALEDALFGLWSGLSTNVVGDTATVTTDAEIRQAIYALENASVDTLDGDTAFFFHPYTFYVQLGAVAKYYDQSQRGPNSAAGFVGTGYLNQGNYQTGLKGVLYGIPTYVSSRIISGLSTYRNLLCHKEAFGFATQNLTSPLSMGMEGGRVRAQAEYQLRNLGWLAVVDMLLGVTELRDGHGVVINGSSAFIGS